MRTETVQFSKEGAVAVVTLNRPENGNRIDAALAAGFFRVMESIQNDPAIKVVLLTGSGDAAFSLGTESAGDPQPLTPVLDEVDLPKIAVVNGDAVGQGLELALACDLRVAADTAAFEMPQVADGQIPWDGGTQRLQRVVGKAAALELVLLAGRIDAAEARRIGLINRMVPAGELRQTGMEMAKAIAGKGPIAVRYVREAINQGMDLTLAQGLRLEADLYYLIQTTEDRREGIEAFREKRAPVFGGK